MYCYWTAHYAIVILIIFINYTDAEFTCQGGSYASALNSCPDKGSQSLSSGGNVTIKVFHGMNIPNMDMNNPSSLVSDPYVIFRAGSVLKRTKVVSNNLNPTWNEEVHLGVLGSATQISVELWDADSGLELADDLLISGTFRVPFCSSFEALSYTVDCGHPFNCESHDSLWSMPTRQVCNETGFINLTPQKSCTSGGVCIYVQVLIVPFKMTPLLTYPGSNIQTPVGSVVGNPFPLSWSNDFGQPFTDSTVRVDTAVTSKKLIGGYMMRTANAEKSFGRAGTIKYYAGTNFPAILYVCRYQQDNENGIPSWLIQGFSTLYLRAINLVLASSGDKFQCFKKEVEGTKLNRWGGVEKGAIPIYTNTIPGHESNNANDKVYYFYNSIVVAVPTVVAERDDSISITYDAAQFVSLLFSYGLICIWFIFLTARFLRKINYRTDRISNYLVSRVITGEDRHLLGSLFIDFNASPSNVEYRAHLFHAKNAMLLFMALPCILLFCWGLCCSMVVRPRPLGMGIAFGGNALLFLWFACRVWEKSKWRLSLLAATAIGVSGAMYTLFLLTSLFLDIGVVTYGLKVNFASLSLIFGSLNCIPCLILIFKNDRSHRLFMEIVVTKINEAIYHMKSQVAPEQLTQQEMQVNRTLHALLGEAYSVNPKVPALRFSPVMHEVRDTYTNIVDNVEVLTPEHEVLLTEERKIYGISLGILFIYLMIAIGTTDGASLAFLNICALMFLDFIHLSMSKGESSWSPGFKVVMLVFGRILICSSPLSIWILNYSACFLLYSLTLTYEIIDCILPKLSERKAGDIVFGGGEYENNVKQALKSNDISGNAIFCLIFLMVSFGALLIISGFMAQYQEQLLVPYLSVLGQDGFPVYVFGVSAFVSSLVLGLFMATIRAFELDAHGLLKGWARDTYLLRRNIKLPRLLAISTEFFVILAGLLIYTLTNVTAILVSAIYIPLILLCLGNAYRIWKANDYELVVWPRKAQDAEPIMDEDADALALSNKTFAAQKPGTAGIDDLEAAFNIMGDIFGQNDGTKGKTGGATSAVVPYEDGERPESTESFGDEELPPQEKPLMGFTLPPLKVTGNKLEKEIKMPPLPLKSVLRRKRQNLGIKSQGTAPIVKDLRLRDTVADADQFGNKANDILDINDPWAQFEIQQKPLEKKSIIVSSAKPEALLKSRPTIAGKPTLFQKIRKLLRKWKIFSRIRKGISDSIAFLRNNVSKIYPSSAVYQANLIDDENELEEGKDADEDNDDEEAGEEDEAGQNVVDSKASSGPDSPSKRVSTVSKKKPKVEEEEVEPVVDLSKLPFWDAFFGGYLNEKENIAIGSWIGALVLIMFFGITLSATVQPHYLGFTVWVAWWLALLVGIPIFKYFQCYQFDKSSKEMILLACLVNFLYCVSFFGSYLNGSVQVAGSLWIFDLFIYLPILSYILFITIQWVDSGFKIPASLSDRHVEGQSLYKDIVTNLRSFPALLFYIFLLNLQFYFWVGINVSIAFTLVLIVTTFAYYYINDWAMNDYFLSPELLSFGKLVMWFIMFISFCVGLFNSASPVFSISVFCFTWAFQYCLKIVGRLMIMKKGTYFFFSPFVMPVYSFDASTRDLKEETDLVRHVLMIFIIGTIWGGCFVIFLYPMDIGMAITTSFVLVAISVMSLCVSYVPRQIAKSNSVVSIDAIIEAATIAKDKFYSRRVPLSLEMKEFDDELPSNVVIKDSGPKTLYDKLKEKTCLENSMAIMADTRFLKYVKEDNITDVNVVDPHEQDEYELPWYQQLVKDTVASVKSYARQLWDLLPVNKMVGWRRHNQAPFRLVNVVLEVLFQGRGPFGMFGLGGYLHAGLKGCKDKKYLNWLYPSWTENYDLSGSHKSYVQLSEPLDYPFILSRMLEMDKALDHATKEEVRCATHFLMILLVSADTKLQRERVTFQKFLRENRFRLASNGISPPRDLFTSTSYTSINIPLAAIWLSTLTLEERDRFHLLKQTFNQEQQERDAQIDQVDFAILQEASAHRSLQQKRDKEYAVRLSAEFIKRKQQRVQAFQNSLESIDRQKFAIRKDVWLNDLNCFVEVKEEALYNRFRVACMTEIDEFMNHSIQCLIECEQAQRDIRLGEYGRSYQFVDSDFMPNELSIGDCEGAEEVLGWRCAPGIAENVELFEGGTRPDDVMEGVFRNSWLISALSMIVSTGDFGKGLINEVIRSLFVPHPSLTDGTDTLDTAVGAYCVRIFRNHDWIPVVIDDLLPMRKKEVWTNENRGIAGAHAKECRGLWVSLIEKAFAKYYGSYASLGSGFVHHALEDLTGCEAECLPLSPFSRGINKLALWDELVRYKANGYIIGAGTGSAELADKEILDMGICFNSAYIIYDVKQVDKHRLIRLRNPPGDHEEWKGDWSDRSPLWTRRLRVKTGNRRNDQDNTFFISFDDFLNVFRYLYVCKYYSPKKWILVKHPGLWKKADELSLEVADMMKDLLNEDIESIEKQVADAEAMNRKKALAKIDSAGGLPSKHNPGCVLENNPHYSLRVFRPTDVCITVTQFQAPGSRGGLEVQPFMIIVVKNQDPDAPQRLQELRKEDVLYSTGIPKKDKTLRLYINGINPGLYMILVGAYLSGMVGNFDINVHSNYRCDCLPIWPPAWVFKDGAPEDAGKGSKDSKDSKNKDKLNRIVKKASGKVESDSISTRFRAGLKSLLGGHQEGDDEEDEEDEEMGGAAAKYANLE